MAAIHNVRKYFPNVTKVTDADTPIMIEVTGHDVRAAKRKDHETCAFAVACKRKLNLDGVVISRTAAYLVRGKEAIRCFLPTSVEHEVVSFDRSGHFAPGKYQLSAVPKTARIGSHYGGHTKGNGATKRHFRHMTTGIRTVLGGQAASEEE